MHQNKGDAGTVRLFSVLNGCGTNKKATPLRRHL